MLANKLRMFCVVALAGLLFGGAAEAKKIGPVAIKNGAKQFTANCVMCHQEDAIGKPGLAPSLTNPELLSVATDKFFMATIRDGREDTGMPPFAHLGRKNIRDIVSYLAELK